MVRALEGRAGGDQTFRERFEPTVLYHRARGVHTSVLADERDVLVAEAIRRHNTLDKIQGECLIRGLATADRLLLTTGRIASTSPPPRRLAGAPG